MNYRRSQGRVRLGLQGLVLLLVAAAAAGVLIPSPFYPRIQSRGSTDSATALTTRLGGPDPLTIAICISQAVYPGSARADAVILVPDHDWRTGLIAAALTGPPVNAPILPMPTGPMPPQAQTEIRRLNPRGINGDGGIQVLAVGGVDERVLRQVNEMGFAHRSINAATPAELAEKADHYRAILTGNHPDQVLIVPADAGEYALLAAPWAAQGGHPILFIENGVLPRATRRALDLRPGDAFMYILAPEQIIPQSVAEDMAFFGHVQRMPGGDPFEMAIAFARYTDRGTDFRWWFGANPRVFGWGVSGPGHNFIFASIDEPMHAAVASGLSNRGTHGPLLWIEGDHVPDPVAGLLAAVRPTGELRPDPLLNRGWIIGNEDTVSLRTCHLIDRSLRAVSTGEASSDDE